MHGLVTTLATRADALRRHVRTLDCVDTPACAPRVIAVHRSPLHKFSKQSTERIELAEGLGVVGDAHYGVTVKHRSRVRAEPSTPNLRQVHLIHAELFELTEKLGHSVRPGELGENITTTGIDLLSLPVGTRLGLGQDAVVTITGLRNPCKQINGLSPGLLQHLVRKTADGGLERLAGVMGIVSRGGNVIPDDRITVELPPTPHSPLTTV